MINLRNKLLSFPNYKFLKFNIVAYGVSNRQTSAQSHSHSRIITNTHGRIPDSRFLPIRYRHEIFIQQKLNIHCGFVYLLFFVFLLTVLCGSNVLIEVNIYGNTRCTCYYEKRIYISVTESGSVDNPGLDCSWLKCRVGLLNARLQREPFGLRHYFVA